MEIMFLGSFLQNLDSYSHTWYIDTQFAVEANCFLSLSFALSLPPSLPPFLSFLLPPSSLLFSFYIEA